MAGSAKAPASDYSFTDRLLHRLAFAHPVLQKALGEIETDMAAKRFGAVACKRPVFVTGLPRAGTTLLLEMLYSTGEFATFTYREMPFLLSPILWSDFSKSHRKTAEARERAHGDGMEVSFDSPEAFEEVAWLAYLRDRYLGDARLRPLSADDLTTEFREAFSLLLRKLIAIQSDGLAPKRYLSKNNANIGRIPAIRSIFPDASILVAMRHPVTHVRSLMNQHQRFLALHDTDRFARDYMKWIGHYDLGANFRPIDFAGRGASAADFHPDRADAADRWLQYWIDAYRHAANSLGDGVRIVSYERLLADAGRELVGIAEFAGISGRPAFVANASRLRSPKTRDSALEGATQSRLDEATALYDSLGA